jgi:ferritin-like metal-binding protein YciE
MEDTYHDLDMRALTITTMQTVEEIVKTPVIWVAAVHDDHTDKNHVHALAALNRRLDKPELHHLIEATTQACREQRRELDRILERQAGEREKGEWDREPTREEDGWGD